MALFLRLAHLCAYCLCFKGPSSPHPLIPEIPSACLVFNSLYSILFFTGLRFGFAGAGGVLVTTLIPVFAYLLSYWLYSNPLEKHEVSGLV
ncbi:Uncharacterised protein [Wolinella succinogenes]|nr:Uncharacterised protein [Wolinella succinogenes]